MAAAGGVPMRLTLKQGDAEGAELSVRSGKWDVFTSRFKAESSSVRRLQRSKRGGRTCL